MEFRCNDQFLILCFKNVAVMWLLERYLEFRFVEHIPMPLLAHLWYINPKQYMLEVGLEVSVRTPITIKAFGYIEFNVEYQPVIS